MYTSVLDKSEIVSLVSNPTIEQRKLLSDAKSAVLHTPILRSNFPSLDKFYTFPVLVLMFVGLFSIFILICGKKHFRNNIIPMISFAIGGCVYFVGTLFVYFFSIHSVASFPRYISLLLTSASIMLSLLLTNKYVEFNNKNRVKLNYLVCILIMICLFVLPVRQPKVLDSESLYSIDNINEQYSAEITKNINNSDELALVFGCASFDTNIFSQSVLYHHHIYLDMISKGYDYLDFYYLGDIEIYNDLLELGYDNLRVAYISEISDLKNYDYVYYINLNQLDFDANSNYVILDMDDSDLFKFSETGEFELLN